MTTKPFSWSYSKLKNFETCPKRHLHYDILKDVSDPETAQIREGNNLHKAFEDRLMAGKPLPLGMGQYEKLLANILAVPGQIHGEAKLAITSSFEPTAYFNPAVWFRSVIDATKVRETTASIFDWKTGKVKEDMTQLQLMAVTMFACMPTIQRIKAALVFLAYGQVESAEFVREDVTEIWSEILPRVEKLKQAGLIGAFPPTPSGLCKKYCGVRACPYHGKGA